MTVRHLKTLVAVADSGSFNAAAERLGITQSAVSMQIRALEDDLEVELFDRSRRPPLLNTLGHSLLERAREIVRLYDGLQESVAKAGQLAGALRLGAIPSVTTSILPPALASLRHRHPALQVRIEGGLSTELMAKVARGALDAAVVTEPERLNKDLQSATILDEALIAVRHRSAVGTSDEEMLSANPFVRFNRRAGFGRIVDGALRARGLKVRDTMELDSIEAILLMVSQGLGVTVVPESSIVGRFAKTLYRTPFGDPPVRRRVCLVERSDSAQTQLTAAFREELRRTAEDRAWLLT